MPKVNHKSIDPILENEKERTREVYTPSDLFMRNMRLNKCLSVLFVFLLTFRLAIHVSSKKY